MVIKFQISCVKSNLGVRKLNKEPIAVAFGLQNQNNVIDLSV